MMRQATFDLPLPEARGRADFLPAPSNAAALAAISATAGWVNRRLVLAGPPGSGKTHLAHVWAAEAGGTVAPAAELTVARVPQLAGAPLALDGADALTRDAAGETALFHLANQMAAAGLPLMLTAAAPPGAWGIALPDLASRLTASSVAVLTQPDDALLAAVMVKLFADRQVHVDGRVIDWLLPRMPRSLAAARAIVAALDHRALAARRAVDIDAARAVLAGLAEGGDTGA
jgi:chromosomal replication initiation ATPase DnaA